MKNIFTWLKSDLFIFFLVFIYWFLICFYLQRVFPKSAFIWKQVLQFFHQVQQQIKTAHINDHWPFNEQVNFVKQNGSRYGSTHFFGGKYRISILIDFSFVLSHLIGLAALVSLFLFVSTINTSMYLNFQTRGGAKTITYQYGYPLITCRTINSSVRNLDHVQCNMQEYNMVMQTHQM